MAATGTAERIEQVGTSPRGAAGSARREACQGPLPVFDFELIHASGVSLTVGTALDDHERSAPGSDAGQNVERQIAEAAASAAIKDPVARD